MPLFCAVRPRLTPVREKVLDVYFSSFTIEGERAEKVMPKFWLAEAV